ncbi:unnamed protein product [Allacma fusca]|uniref:Uncharacterized protein n=1 Tax=Allacma fusca TaxID=39272 RepID=A0A8J2NHM4_9HEXA|nr:unnamed protein product [Allacma fusca]
MNELTHPMGNRCWEGNDDKNDGQEDPGRRECPLMSKTMVEAPEGEEGDGDETQGQGLHGQAEVDEGQEGISNGKDEKCRATLNFCGVPLEQSLKFNILKSLTQPPAPFNGLDPVVHPALSTP